MTYTLSTARVYTTAAFHCGVRCATAACHCGVQLQSQNSSKSRSRSAPSASSSPSVSSAPSASSRPLPPRPPCHSMPPRQLLRELLRPRPRSRRRPAPCPTAHTREGGRGGRAPGGARVRGRWRCVGPGHCRPLSDPGRAAGGQKGRRRPPLPSWPWPSCPFSWISFVSTRPSYRLLHLPDLAALLGDERAAKFGIPPYATQVSWGQLEAYPHTQCTCPIHTLPPR